MELELFGESDYQTQSTRLDFVRQKDKTNPLSIESERTPPSMNVKQFENKNISVNLE